MSTRKPSGRWNAEGCADRWCAQLAPAAAREFAESLGPHFGEIAVAAGCVELALVWARAFGDEVVVNGYNEQFDKASALTLVAEALGNDPRAVDVLVEAFANTARVSAVGLLARSTLHDPRLVEAAARSVTRHAGSPAGVAEVAWFAVRARGSSPEAATIRAQLRVFEERGSCEEPWRIAIHAALWMLHRRRGEAAAAAESRAVVLDARERLAEMPHHVNVAVLAAACEAGEFESVADSIGRCAQREFVDACVAAGQLDRAVAAGSDRSRVRLARRLRGAAPVLLERARRLEGDLERFVEEGLLTWQEEAHLRFEFAALRDDRAQRAAELVGLVAAEVEKHGLSQIDEVLADLQDPDDLSDRPDPVWQTPRGAQKLERAVTAWSACTRDKRHTQIHHARTILAAATSFALSDDIPRARELMTIAFADDEMGIAISPEVEASAVAAWVATDQVSRAFGFADGRRTKPAALRPLIVALVDMGESGWALDLLGPALEHAMTMDDYEHLAIGALALADDFAATRDAMLEAVDRGYQELEKFGGPREPR